MIRFDAVRLGQVKLGKEKYNVFAKLNLTFEHRGKRVFNHQISLYQTFNLKVGIGRGAKDKWFTVWKIQYWAKQHGQYRSDNFVIEYIEGAPCWVELVRGVRGPV